MRQISPGVFIDDLLPHEWKLELKLGDGMSLPMAVIVNGQWYVRKKKDGKDS
jgi:hypothetical protein